MWIFAFALLLIVIALLSKPGLLSKHPLSGSPLSILQGIVLLRGVSFMLMIPVLVLLSMEYPAWGVFTSSALTSIILIFILVPFVAAFITTHDRDDKHRNYYAGLKVGGGFWWKYLITTAVYMISYEILMRGVLLHYLLDKMGVFYAIALNTLIYSGMHLVKNKQEALLSVPLGVLLCWMTIYTRSIWPAAFFHLVMAVSFEFYYSMKK